MVFCHVKWNGKYFTKEWSGQKVLVIEVSELVPTKSIKIFQALSSFTSLEKIALEFLPPKNCKILLSVFISPKIGGFRGVKPTLLGSKCHFLYHEGAIYVVKSKVLSKSHLDQKRNDGDMIVNKSEKCIFQF